MSPASPKTQEPTMEEILASIRRIIADDQAAAQAEAVEEEDEAPEPEPEPADDEPQSQSAIDDMFAEAGGDDDEDDVLDLAEVAEPVAKAREPSPLDLDHEDIDFREAGPDLEPLAGFDEPEIEEEEPEPEPEDAFAFAAPEPMPAPPPPRPRPAFEAPPPRRDFDEERLLSDTTDAAVSGAFNMLAHTVLANNGRTLDDLVKEMLRPMLKVWLDDNLPVIVERLVRAEIERVSRGR